jgi:hypothetical protein
MSRNKKVPRIVAQLVFATALISSTAAAAPPSATFTIQLSSDQAAYASAQPIMLTVAIQNTGAASGILFTRHSAHRDLRLIVISQGKSLPPNLSFIGEAGADRDIGLAPGEKFIESEPLSKWRYALAPGDYTISGEYFYDVNGVTLKTNTVHITVTP